MTRVAPELEMALHIKAESMPAPEREYRFHPGRQWRFDFAWPDRKIALEVEGGVFSGGRHTRGKGYTEDCRKYSEGALLGWCVIRATPAMVRNGTAIWMLKRGLQGISP